eukprot:1521030-Pyramimonas_sp.AAC.1
MASRLQDSHPLAIDMISITDGKVELRHPPSFQAWVDQVQTEAAESAKAELEDRRRREGDRVQIRAQVRALERRARLWSPLNRRISLSA